MSSHSLISLTSNFSTIACRHMSSFAAMILLFSSIAMPVAANSAEPAKVQFDTYGGYFVSNKFEPNASESYVLITDQEAFGKTFGIAFVMGDKSHRLPEDVFEEQVVIGVVKRGTSIWTYQVKQITESEGELEIRYSTKEQKQSSATFASPLIVSVPKKSYRVIRFIDNGKLVKALKPDENNQ